MRTNTKPLDHQIDTDMRLAGGFGPAAAKQESEALLRRAVLANLLWERNAYIDGVDVAKQIIDLVPQVEPEVVASLAIEARTVQKLRHVPLLLARECVRHKSHRHVVGALLPQILLRADEPAEFLSLYWKDGKCPLAKQVKLGLAASFKKFTEYHFAKYDRNMKVKLRDAMFLAHPKPPQGQEELYTRIAKRQLTPPDTWEVALSTGKDKKETWKRLIQEKKLGALAFLRNLASMERENVPRETIRTGLETLNARWLLPKDYLAAALAAPRWEQELEALMLQSLSHWPKLTGHSVLIVDVSGSMGQSLSKKSQFSRLDVGAMLCILATEVCHSVSIYATAGSDSKRKHATRILPTRRGFAIQEVVKRAENLLGRGGIFTRQCLEWIKNEERDVPERVIVFSDSQDCDDDGSRKPAPFGKHNYIVDVSAETHGINYRGLWTAEISGWSEGFLRYIAAAEWLSLPVQEEEQ